ncbi:FluG domain-containing protein [Diaporthe sp. PMI_573]|nr:FluG domain-containing protein [Diaporthaceae sp. PMI_573]
MNSNRTNARAADFLKEVRVRDADARASKRRPMSVEGHARMRQTLEGVLFIKPRYAHETEVNVSGMLAKWHRYCNDMKVGDWKVTISNITRSTMQDFFLWVCENYNISTWGTSKVYIRQFGQLYTTVTGRYPDRNDMKELYKYHDNILIPTFNLQVPNAHGKPVVNCDDLKILVTYNIAYDPSIRSLELQRLNDAGCYMTICYTGIRPAEIVEGERKPPKDGSQKKLFGTKVVMSADANAEVEDGEGSADEDSKKLHELLLRGTIERGRPKALCYEDILMMLVRHPVTGKSILAMSLKFIFHKGCDNRPKPTIFILKPTKKLIFCPVSLYLAIALFDDAFDSKLLKDASSVLGAKIPAGQDCLQLRWKRSKLKIPFFRRIFRDGTISKDQAMLYSTLREHMGDQSLDAGFEKKLTPKAGRRGAGNAANGDAPDAVRDQILRQNPKFFVFQDAYLNITVNFDIQNAFLEEEKEIELFRMFAHVSLTRDPRATKDMVPPEVWANLPPDPCISGLEERRAMLKHGQYRFDGRENESEIRELTAEIRSKQAQRERQIVKDYREYYFYNRPTWDLEEQARGGDVEEYNEPPIDLIIPERAKLAEILCHQPENLPAEEIHRLRLKVVELYPPPDDGVPLTSKIQLEPEVDLFPLLMGPTQCPGCIGDERQTVQERIFPYCRETKRNDHFDDHHLEEIERAEQHGDPINCIHPKCRERRVYFQSVDHFRNHNDTIHGVKLRTSKTVQQRRARKLKLRKK